MPTLKDTKKAWQYLRELEWENCKINLVFNLGIISDTTLLGASAFKSRCAGFAHLLAGYLNS